MATWQLFFVTVLARPRQDNPRFGEFGGAYVNCWIDEESEDAAISRAEAEVRDSAWIPESIENVRVVTRDAYEEQEEGREHFEQALIDGVVLVFHAFPNEPEDEAVH